MCCVCASQFHLAELGKPDELNPMMPGLGRDWSELCGGTQTAVYYGMCTYATQWDMVAARWVEGDYAILQPLQPCWHFPIILVHNMLKQKVAKNELELCVSQQPTNARQDYARRSRRCASAKAGVLGRPQARRQQWHGRIERRALRVRHPGGGRRCRRDVRHTKSLTDI
jgi:hypothetical protein